MLPLRRSSSHIWKQNNGGGEHSPGKPPWWFEGRGPLYPLPRSSKNAKGSYSVFLLAGARHWSAEGLPPPSLPPYLPRALSLGLESDMELGILPLPYLRLPSWSGWRPQGRANSWDRGREGIGIWSGIVLGGEEVNTGI
jgi:hypothetical protein